MGVRSCAEAVAVAVAVGAVGRIVVVGGVFAPAAAARSGEGESRPDAFASKKEGQRNCRWIGVEELAVGDR